MRYIFAHPPICPLNLSETIGPYVHFCGENPIYDYHKSPSHQSTLCQEHFHQTRVGPDHRHPFRADKTVPAKRRRGSHQRVRKIFGEKKAGAQGQESPDGGAYDAATEESGDIQVLQHSAGGGEWAG